MSARDDLACLDHDRCPNCTPEGVECADGCPTCDAWYVSA